MIFVVVVVDQRGDEEKDVAHCWSLVCDCCIGGVMMIYNVANGTCVARLAGELAKFVAGFWYGSGRVQFQTNSRIDQTPHKYPISNIYS